MTATAAEKLAADLGTGGVTSAKRKRKVWVCKLLELRESLGLKQRDVARAVGVSQTILSDWELGTNPGLSHAADLAAFYGKRIDEIWVERLPR
jgi:DNA-binding XRE family transcriptional regulator